MRVTHVINRLERSGGAETSLYQLLPHLAQHGVESTVLTLYPDVRPGRRDQVVALGFPVYELGAGGLVDAARRIRPALRDLAPDLVHATLFDATTLALPAARTLRIPAVESVVNSVHGPESRQRETRAWVRAGLRATDIMSACLAGGVHAITAYAAEVARRELLVAPRKIAVIPRGRDRDLLGWPSAERRARVRQTLGIASEQAVVLNVARQDKQKGQRYLLEAFAAVAGCHPEALLVLAGREGEATRELQSQRERLHLGERVKVLGARDDVPDLLVAADVFAFPSLWEGLGGAVLEAMAMRVPVVASNLPPVAEVLSGTGVLVPPGDSQALARALDHCLREPRGARLQAERAFLRFEAEYRIETVAARTAEWYGQIVMSAGRGQR